MATSIIDRQPLKGRPADPQQANQFPRAYMARGILPRQQYFELVPGWWYEQETPQRVKEACCEQAMFLLSLTEYENERRKQQVLGILGESVGSSSEMASDVLGRQNRKRTILCPEARELLLPYLVGSVAIF